MEYTFAQYQESAQALRDRLGAFRPRCLLILGSGLGSCLLYTSPSPRD